MKTSYNEWEKVAREEIRKTEEEEEEQKKANDKACGLEDGPQGPAVAAAAAERKEQENLTAARSDVIKKLKGVEKQITSPKSGEIDAAGHGIRIVKAADVSLDIKNHPLKVFLDDCTGTSVTIADQMITSSLEVYNSKDVTIELCSTVATIQLDKVDGCLLNLANEDMTSIVHDQCSNVRVHAGGKIHELPTTTVQSVSKWKSDQFVTVAVARDEGKFPMNIENAQAVEGAAQDAGAQALKFKDEGNSAFKASDFLQAAAFYTQSLDAHPNDVVYCNRSQCWLKLGQHERALEDARAAAKINPSNTKAYFREGISLHALERYAEAIPAFAKAENLDPKNKQITDAIRMAQLKARQQAAPKQ